MLRTQNLLFLVYIFATIIIIHPDTSLSINQDNNNQQPSENLAVVNQLRFWSNPHYTRIVIDADNETAYTHSLEKSDNSIKPFTRLIIDIKNSKLSEGIRKNISINQELVNQARLQQLTSGSVKVIIDIKTFRSYKIFSLTDPFRIVIDIWGKSTKASRSLKKQIGADKVLGVKRICIDAGFGGHDFGARGHKKGVYSKDINLKVAKKLAKKITENLQVDVIMTRNSDIYLSLEERTTIANTKSADLFISIHTNAATDQRAYGIETYFLNLATDDEAILATARENATSSKNISDLHAILSDLMQNEKVYQSALLANLVQEYLYTHMKKRYSNIKNRGTKKVPFYVLLGAQMPAVLVATSFISNPRECKRLSSEKYQDDLCQGIINGIQKYIKKTN